MFITIIDQMRRFYYRPLNMAFAVLVMISPLCTIAVEYNRQYTHAKPAHLLDDDTFARHAVEYTHVIASNVERVIITKEVPLKRVFDRMVGCHAVQARKTQELLYELTQILDLINQVPTESDQEVLNEIRCAMLVQLIVPLDNLVRKLFLTLLDHVDARLTYWEEQSQRPLYYFFHKSPTKWWHSTSQEAELNEKISFLKRHQELLFHALGSWASHINTFNPEANIQSQYKWIAGTLNTLYTVLRGEKLDTERVAEFDKLTSIMRECIIRFSRFYATTVGSLTSVEVPSYITRNWISSSVVGIGSLVAGALIMRHKEAIPGFMNQMRNTLYSTLVATPRDALAEAFPFLNPILRGQPAPAPAPQSNDRPKTFATASDQVSKAINQVSQCYGQSNNNNSAPAKTLTDEELKQSFMYTIQQFLQYRQAKKMNPFMVNGKPFAANDQELKERLQEYAGRLDQDFLMHCINQCISGDLPIYSNSWDYAARGELVAHTVSMAQVYFQLLRRMNSNAGTIIQNQFIPAFNGLLQNAALTSDQLLLQVNQILDQVQRVLRQNQLNFALIACIPTAALISGTLASSVALYRRMFEKVDYDHIRETIIEIAHLLNHYADVQSHDMWPEHYGQLLYLGHKLRKQKLKVPRNQRVQFGQDIARLSNGHMNAKQKLLVIDLMYKRYSFLKREK